MSLQQQLDAIYGPWNWLSILQALILEYSVLD